MRSAAATPAAPVAVHRRPGGPPTAAVVVLLGALTATTAFTVVTLPYQHTGRATTYLLLLGACWTLFAVAVVLLRRVPLSAVPALVLIGTAAIGGAAIAGPPDTTTDTARYAWDGIVQDAGISPYAAVPADARLARLRPEWLFPTPATDAAGAVCRGALVGPTPQVGAPGTVCTVINRPQVPTIYPPAAEIVFAAVRAMVPVAARYWPIQALGLLVMLVVTAVLLAALRRRGRDPRLAALWGWCPLVAAEGVTNSHIDLLGAALSLGASLLVVRAAGRRGTTLLGGVLLGLAVAVKLTPLLVAPPLLRRSPLRVGLAALVTVALLYVPYVLESGVRVLGYLPGYLTEEGYDSGTRSAVLAALLPPPLVTPVAAVLLAAVVVTATIRAGRGDPFVAQLVIIGASLLLASPRYGWYSLLLVPFVAMTGRWEWFTVALVLTFSQLTHPTAALVPAILGAGAICLIGTLFRHRVTAARRTPS